MKKIEMQFGNMEVTNEVVARLDSCGYTPDALQEKIYSMQDAEEDAPRVYVGTYAKYNAGILRGLWVCVTKFDNYEDFMNFCRAIHADEKAPELMYQDFENFPREFYCECGMSEENFDEILEYALLCDEYGREPVDAYLEVFGAGGLENFCDKYVGEYESEEAFAIEVLENSGILDKLRHLCSWQDFTDFIDYKAYAVNIFATSYEYSNGYVFYNC